MTTSTQSTDPQTVAPPAPYEVLDVGTVTKKRDIKRIKISGQWEGIGAHEIDRVTKESDGSVYARARAPHGYALVGEQRQSLLAQYANGEIALFELMSGLQAGIQ